MAGLGEQPPIEFMADAGAVCGVAGKGGAGRQKPHRTLLAGIAPSGIDRAGSDIVVVPGGRREMVERGRTVTDDGLCKGLDAANFATARAAGNAVCPPVARWIAEKLMATFQPLQTAA